MTDRVASFIPFSKTLSRTLDPASFRFQVHQAAPGTASDKTIPSIAKDAFVSIWSRLGREGGQPLAVSSILASIVLSFTNIPQQAMESGFWEPVLAVWLFLTFAVCILPSLGIVAAINHFLQPEPKVNS